MNPPLACLPAAVIALQLVVPAQPAGAQPAFPQVFRDWSELSVRTSSSAVAHVQLSSGNLILDLTAGRAAPVMAGAAVVGIFFRGRGALEYASVDPIESPIVSYNVKKNTGLEARVSGPRLVIRDTFDELLFLAEARSTSSSPAGSTSGWPTRSRTSTGGTSSRCRPTRNSG